MKTIGLLSALTICLVACASVADAPEDTQPISSQAVYKGVYAGTYTCARGENGITVSVDRITHIEAARSGVAGISARLWFYDVSSNPGHPTGAFELNGILDLSKVDMIPGEWLSDIPENWGAAGVEGEFVKEDGDIYFVGEPSGPGTSACQTFKLKKLVGL
ncbi:MAG: hypothetical protein AAF296_03130 [Pseudomonadota bacterium]